MKKEFDLDRLEIDSCGPWAEKKFQLLACYAEVFSSSMKDKWDNRVYLDLFSGSGLARIKKTTRLVDNCATSALAVKVPFDRYVFCDSDESKLNSLKARVKVKGMLGTSQFVLGDSNVGIDEVIKALPVGSSAATCLTFCLVDPYKFEDLKFATIKKLSESYIDFLVFIPSYMEAHRFKEENLEEPKKISEFLGNEGWVERWPAEEKKGEKFGNFIVKEFGRSMQELKFIFEGIDQALPIRLEKNNRTLYHLAFFSRNKLGVKFFQDCKKLTSPQLTLGI